MKISNKKFFALSMVLCLGITTQAWGYTDSDARGGSCGTDCTWSYDGNGNLTIKGSGAANQSVSKSWNLSNTAVSSVVIEGIKTLPKDAFKDYANLKNVSTDNTLKTIGKNAFKSCSSLTTLYIPDSVETIEEQALANLGSNTTIIIPDDATYKKKAFIDSTADIICQGNVATCEQKATAANAPAGSTKPASELQCFGDKHYWNGTNCVNEPTKANRTCSSSYKMNDGLCDRIRYTPAEAAKVVTNDNNNSVTITFKK